MERLRSRVRRWTLFFIFGLVLSGITALPLHTAAEWSGSVLGPDLTANGRIPEFAAEWLRTLREGIRVTAEKAPFMFYGTDWLAFGHFTIALAFVGAVRDPVRNRWLYQFGMIACALVPVWALVFGHFRGIPVWWRLIDSAFGVLGFLPVWLCHRWTEVLEQGHTRYRKTR
jgi:hypothetical protein